MLLKEKKWPGIPRATCLEDKSSESLKAQQLGQRSMDLVPMAAAFPFFSFACIFS